MSNERLIDLARTAGHEPYRGCDNTPEMRWVRPGVREIALRLEPGKRTFAAIVDEGPGRDGLVIALELMEPGGDEDAVMDRLERQIVAHRLKKRVLKVIA